MKLCISFLVWEIHKPIAVDGGSNVGAGKMDNQCVEKIPLSRANHIQPVLSGYSLFSVWITRLKFAFLRFPYQQITATTEAIDDPQSRYYNRIV